MSDFNSDLNYSYVHPAKLLHLLRFHGVPARFVALNQTDRNDGGVDATVYLEDGTTLTIDVKKRRKVFPDRAIPLELTSGYQPGWAVDARKLTDLVLVVWPDSQSNLFPARQIRKALRKNKKRWISSYGLRGNTTTRFETYSSTFLPVPATVLSAACRRVA